MSNIYYFDNNDCLKINLVTDSICNMFTNIYKQVKFWKLINAEVLGDEFDFVSKFYWNNAVKRRRFALLI